MGIGGGNNLDPSSILAPFLQAQAQGSQRIRQNALDLGLGAAGQNWTGPGWPMGGPDNAPPAFPAGTVFAGQIPGFPPGTAPGTLPTAEQGDLANLSFQTQAAEAQPIDQLNNLINQQNQQQSAAFGQLLGSGIGGIGGLLGV